MSASEEARVSLFDQISRIVINPNEDHPEQDSDLIREAALNWLLAVRADTQPDGPGP